MNKIILAILDGVGVSSNVLGNAVINANTPALDFIYNNYSHSYLKASGEYVGLPNGQMGNSEVGHITIGAGRIVDQPLQRINKAIESNELFYNKSIIDAFNHAKENDSKVHIMGLLSDGGVHSHIDHLFYLIKMAKYYGVEKLYIHVFLDGRDTLPNVSLNYLDKLALYLKEIDIGKIATISGRYYSMDREQMWDRTKKAYDAIVNNYGQYYSDYHELINESYHNEEFDEFITPTIIDKHGIVEDDDSIILANFRPDRITELFSAITNHNFNHFVTKKLNNIKLVTMMPVDKSVICTNAFFPLEIDNTLGKVLDKNNYHCLRIAETSKFPHVTHFFDGDVDLKLSLTKKICIPKKNVDTYDLCPEMSALEVTDYIIKNGNNYEFILVNFANGDMVGHTGDYKACIKAMETIDSCIMRLHGFASENNFTLFITADHGNCEEMIDETGNKLTTHTTNPVNFVICNTNYIVKNGSLSDIAPTILNYVGINIPEEMTGNIIIEKS